MNENYHSNESSQDIPCTRNPPSPHYDYTQANFLNGSIPPGYSKTVTIGDWLIYTLLNCIPLVNIVALIYFALDNDKPSRANMARLSLIIFAIGIACFFLFAGCALAIGLSSAIA